MFSSESSAQTASISVNTTQVCQNGTQPVITFTGSGGTLQYTFTYTINGGDPRTTGVSAGNIATVNVPTDVANTFTYALVSVQDNNGGGASVNQGGSVQVTVLSTAPINASHNTDHETSCVNFNPGELSVNPTGGTGNYSYQWQFSSNGSTWTPIGGATDETYDPPALTTAPPGGQLDYYYRVVVSDECNSYTTSPKRITILADPTITITDANQGNV
ncbi:MAG TPA: hypothetical protein PK951_09610, partial [Chitinophagaceae bacterium]|nr:hypothetical protein [Chitinophagaceae bacterium]